MALFGKDIHDLSELYMHTLQDIYYAEKKIEQSLPKMIDKAGSEGLRSAFTAHLEETHTHVTRLEQVFEMHGQSPKAVNCPAIDGIVEEAEKTSGDIGDPDTLDAALAAAAQAVEHYEISRYGTLIAWARELGHEDAAQVLQTTLKEEKAADEKLTALAEQRLNRAA
jgi:ferritin-like metal-binding protein YciE